MRRAMTNIAAGMLVLFLLAACAAAQDFAKKRLEDSPRHHEWAAVRHGTGGRPPGERTVHCFLAFPEISRKTTAVVVIHENRGLTDWVRGVADQLAEQGYLAIAPDLLSGAAPGGGKTSDFPDMDAAREALYKLPPDQVLADLDAAADHVVKLPAASGKLVVAGFCWGGGQSFRFATHRKQLAAALVFYGPSPEIEQLAKIECPVHGFYAENDARINAALPQVETVMRQQNKTFEAMTYQGAGHGFMRAGEEPGASPGNKAARDQAWIRWKGIMEKLP